MKTQILFIGNSFTNRNDVPGMLTALARLLNSDDGATAIEYGLIAALIAVAAIAAFQLVGTNLSSTFHNIATQL